VAASSGHGFIVPEDEVVAMTRKGKQVLNVDEPAEACVCVPAEGDMVAAIGENRKMLIFPIEEVNEMSRGKGVILQRFKDGSLSDLRVFNKSDGLTWLDPAGRTFTLPFAELRDWLGQRAQAGRLAPRGFPKSNKFGPAF
jgi:topoisomerase-4 subunit A